MYWLFCLSVCILSSSPISFQTNTLKCNGSISIIHKEHELCIVMHIAPAAFEAITVLLLKTSCGKLLLFCHLQREGPGNVHLTPTSPQSTPLYCSSRFPDNSCLAPKKYKACESLNPNQSSLFIPALIPAMFQWMTSHRALCCFKTSQWNRPLHFVIQLAQLGSKCKSHNCSSLSFVRLVQQKLQAFRGCGNFCQLWRRGEACRVVCLILVALKIWEGKESRRICFQIPVRTSHIFSN